MFVLRLIAQLTSLREVSTPTQNPRIDVTAEHDRPNSNYLIYTEFKGLPLNYQPPIPS